MDNTEQEKVKDLLKDIQLDQYYRQIHGKLHITRLSHFDHVTEEDLDDLGMAKPEQRRLFEALKKAKKKSLFSSFRRKVSSLTYPYDRIFHRQNSAFVWAVFWLRFLRCIKFPPVFLTRMEFLFAVFEYSEISVLFRSFADKNHFVNV